MSSEDNAGGISGTLALENSAIQLVVDASSGDPDAYLAIFQEFAVATFSALHRWSAMNLLALDSLPSE